MQEALAAGDVDAMRLLLAQAQPAAVSPAADPPPQPDMLTARAESLANSLLARGLATLERAEAASASREPEPQHAQRTVRLSDLGLEIIDSPVMGQTIWPAALALCRWLKEHPTRVRGAHVLELGAGAGAPGLVTLALGAASLTLTDADASLLPLLRANVALNTGSGSADSAAHAEADVASKAGDPKGEPAWEASSREGAGGAAGACCVCELDWRQADHVATARGARPEGFALLLAADVTFGVGDFTPLVRAAAALLCRTPRARLLLARSAWFEDLQPTLLAAAEEAGLRLLGVSEDAQAGAAVLEMSWSTLAGRGYEIPVP